MLLGNQPKSMLSGMAKALQMHTWNNNEGDWRRLEALRALGYKVVIPILGGAKELKEVHGHGHGI